MVLHDSSNWHNFIQWFDHQRLSRGLRQPTRLHKQRLSLLDSTFSIHVAEPWKIENYRAYVACEKHAWMDRNTGAKPAGGGV